MLNGKPSQILSGKMHYARIPHAYWCDRMEMAKANTITIFDIDGVSSPHLAGLTTPILNGPTRETDK